MPEQNALPDAVLLAMIRFVRKLQFYANYILTYHMCLFVNVLRIFFFAPGINSTFIERMECF